MTWYFIDLNVWLALSVVGHPFHSASWTWLNALHRGDKLIFSRFTQIGLLRLLTNAVVMGEQTLTLGEAWAVYDRWRDDPRVEFHPEPRDVDAAFIRATKPHAAKPASKWVGDCWLVAFAAEARATLVTFDRALYDFARKQGHSATIPA